MLQRKTQEVKNIIKSMDSRNEQCEDRVSDLVDNDEIMKDTFKKNKRT